MIRTCYHYLERKSFGFSVKFSVHFNFILTHQNKKIESVLMHFLPNKTFAKLIIYQVQYVKY